MLRCRDRCCSTEKRLRLSRIWKGLNSLEDTHLHNSLQAVCAELLFSFVNCHGFMPATLAFVEQVDRHAVCWAVVEFFLRFNRGVFHGHLTSWGDFSFSDAAITLDKNCSCSSVSGVEKF